MFFKLMWLSKYSFLLLSILILINVSQAGFANEAYHQKASIVWVKNDAPPFFILRGEQQGNGIGDKVQKILEANLPQYEHETVEMTLARLNHSWTNDLNLCFVSMIHETSHSPDYTLSKPNMFYYPHGIITTKDFAKIISEDLQDVSLEKLIQKKNIRIGHISDRTFGIEIDTILRKHKDNLSIIERSGSDQTRGVLEMLIKKRFDFIIDYPYIIDFYAEDFNDNLIFIPIKENKNQLTPGAIGCTNNRWGKRVIQDINSAIEAMLETEEYKNILKQFLIPSSSHPNRWIEYKAKLESL